MNISDFLESYEIWPCFYQESWKLRFGGSLDQARLSHSFDVIQDDGSIIEMDTLNENVIISNVLP